jgi:hypothetical protein
MAGAIEGHGPLRYGPKLRSPVAISGLYSPQSASSP